MSGENISNNQTSAPRTEWNSLEEFAREREITPKDDFAGERNINDKTGKVRTFSEWDIYPRMAGESAKEYGERLKRMHQLTAEYEASEQAKAEQEAKCQESVTRAIQELSNVNSESITRAIEELMRAKAILDGDDKPPLSATEKRYKEMLDKRINNNPGGLTEEETNDLLKNRFKKVTREEPNVLFEKAKIMQSEKKKSLDNISEPTPKPLSALDRYKQMLNARTGSVFTREEADDLFERVQAKATAKKEIAKAKAEVNAQAQTEPEIPETITEENAEWWGDWTNNMSKEDRDRWLAWSKSHDEENLKNLKNNIEELKSDPESLKSDPAKRQQLEKLEQRYESVQTNKNKVLDNAPVVKPSEAVPTKQPESQAETTEIFDFDTYRDVYFRLLDETKARASEIARLEKLTSIEPSEPTPSPAPKPNLYYAGDDESITNITPNVEPIEWHVPGNIKKSMDEQKSNRLREKVEQEYNRVKQKADNLKEYIKQNYDLIGGEEGAKLLNPQPNAPGTEAADYERWWSSLSDEGRQKIAEIVNYVEQENILDFDTTSPVNLAFLTWYHGLMNR